MKAALIYPHQLFEKHPACTDVQRVYLIEDPLLFSQFAFHKQKLILHRASMKAYESTLTDVSYIECKDLSSTSDIARVLQKDGVRSVQFCDLTDDWLHQRLVAGLKEQEILYTVIDTPNFFLTEKQSKSYSPKRKEVYFFNDFYISQRKGEGILLDSGKPLGGKWSFDDENRKKLPRDIVLPASPRAPICTNIIKEAIEYVAKHFSKNPGYGDALLYPYTHQGAREHLVAFLEERFSLFGDYEDAISNGETFLFHSVLTPMLNIGLLTPREIVEAALACAVPLNSKEGFIRQVIGWREFIRTVYIQRGRVERTRNVLGNTRSIPTVFYSAETGIPPVDDSISKVLRYGYCHHIERLMVLGNFMLLCDINPHSVYQWFMELFVDAYDWVMVPNVYGMSQFADGGLMATKPYISGSSYILKMSNHHKGKWCEVWDALYWRFIDRHYDMIKGNPRMSVMAGMRDTLKSSGKLKTHLERAGSFLESM